ncbi:MAG: DUF4136 domain-containing protein [Polyangiales bacterium]
MLRRSSLIILMLSCVTVFGCGSVSKIGEISVYYDENTDFSQFETFTVLTPELVPDGRDPEDDEELFNDRVNDLIVEAMTAEPVCMRFIPPEEVTDANEPDLYAANGLTRSTEEGVTWQCVGGWWWGAWGRFWDPCRWRTQVPVQLEVGSLYLPVGPRPEQGEDPTPVFTGTARALLGTGSNVDEKVRTAVRAIFEQWPHPRTCSP